VPDKSGNDAQIVMPRQTRLISLAWLAAAAGFLALAQSLPFAPHPLGPFGRPVLEKYAFTDVASVLFGVRRFGADLAFIQMLQYYARPEEAAAEAGHDHGGHPPGAHGEKEYHLDLGVEATADLHPEMRLGEFPRLQHHIFRIVSLDPYFHYAYLFGAGALAFNLNRIDEALEILERGVRADPRFWRFRLYAGAIAYRRSAEPQKAIGLLEQAIQFPDCPSMLKNILANLHRQQGNYIRAAEVYLDIIRTSRDQGYVNLAHQRLRQLQEEHGLVIE
jgi:tetratricopeptide (TPR) repeat protein